MLDETTTDENGYFFLTYQRENFSYYPVLQTSSGNDIIIIPWDTNIYDISTFISPTCNILIYLNVINEHNAGDTLIVNNLNDFLNDIEVVGPFESGLLYEVENFPMLGMAYDPFAGGAKYISYIDLGFKIGETTEWSIKTFNINSCNTEYITIDIY